MLEILKANGIEEEKANEIVRAMKEAKLFTTKLENADERYNKLKEQKKLLEESNKNFETQINELSKNNQDNKELLSQIEQLQLSNNELKEQHRKELYQLEFNNALDKTLSDAKAKDNSLLKTLLNMDSIKLQEGKLEGLESQIEAIKGTHSYLFEEEKPVSMGGLGNFGRNAGQGTKKEFKKMSLAEKMELYTKDREAYEALKNNN